MVLRPPAIEPCTAAAGSAVSRRTKLEMRSAAAALSAAESMSVRGRPSASEMTRMFSGFRALASAGRRSSRAKGGEARRRRIEKRQHSTLSPFAGRDDMDFIRHKGIGRGAKARWGRRPPR